MKRNRIDKLADQLVKSGNLSELESELKKFDVAKLPDDEREAWRNMYGIAAFRRGDHREALERFMVAHEEFPDSAEIAFSLGQEFEFVGELDRAFTLFAQLRFPAAPSLHVLAAARYAYLWGRYDEGLGFLESIFEAYLKLGIADDHFLYVRGLPFFGSTWATAGAFCELTNRLPELRSRTEQWAKALMDYDFDRLVSDLVAVEQGNLEAMLRRARASAEEHEKNRWPAGYPRVRAAVLESKTVGTVADADLLLTGVTLGENDYGWLADIVLLARIGVRHRLGTDDTVLIEEFLRRQPLLFEPEHIFNFRLVAEQEPLKQIYRERQLARH